MIKYAYISSLPRSGSTLLSILLGSHEHVFSLGEFSLFGQALQLNPICLCGKRFCECEVWGWILKQLNLDPNVALSTHEYQFNYSKSSLNLLLERIYRKSLNDNNLFLFSLSTLYKRGYPFHVKEALQRSKTKLDEIYRLYDDPSLILLDSSKYTQRMQHYYMEYPGEMKVIALIRNGRGTIHSYMKSEAMKFKDALHLWRYHFDLQVKALAKIEAKDRLIVHYENLCMDPSFELKRICNFINIDYREQMLRMEKPLHMLGGNPNTYQKYKTIQIDNEWERFFNSEQSILFSEVSQSIKSKFCYDFLEEKEI